ncbi:MAG: thioredoxin domain-containing protein, partial [Bacteroidota bacterium]
MNIIHTYSIPLAIVIGAAMVAVSIVYTHAISPQVQSGSAAQVAGDLMATREDNRAIYGDIAAPVTIVEFSDYQCPYCSRLHPTLKQIVDESGGGINWEYRHL